MHVVATRRHRGWVRPESRRTLRTEFDADAPFLARILAAPDDMHERIVYGDWLLSNGDPRGELLAACEGERERARDIVNAEEQAFFGEAAPASGEELHVEWDRGFFSHVAWVSPLGPRRASGLEWLASLLRHPSAHLAHSLEVDASNVPDDGALARVFAEDGAPRLRHITLVAVGTPVLEALIDSPLFERLTTLDISASGLEGFAGRWFRHRATKRGRLERLTIG